MAPPPSPPTAPTPVATTSSAALDSLRSFPTSQSTTSRGLQMPGRWRNTLASTFGYGTAAAAATTAVGEGAASGGGAQVAGGARRKMRGGIPLFSPDSADDQAQQVGEQQEEQAPEKEQQPEPPLNEEQRRRKRELDEVCSRVMYLAPPSPTSSSSPHLLLIALCHLPPPPITSSPYDDEEEERAGEPKVIKLTQGEVMSGLRERLEGFAKEAGEGGYEVILFTTPTPHPPPTALLISTYLALTRETLLSRKTARKITQLPALSALARGVQEGGTGVGREGFLRLDIPLEVYTANALVEPDITLPPLASGEKDCKMYGVELEELMGRDGEVGLPRVVRDCLEVLGTDGVDSVGIFRRSPSAANVKILQGIYDRGHPLTLPLLPDAPYLAASLLKSFLRELPNPIFPVANFYQLARDCPLPTNPACVGYIAEEILPRLRPAQVLLLKELCETLHVIAENAATNLMDSNNLAVVLTPNLIGGLGASEMELEMCRVPGMEVGTMRGLRKVEGKEGRNTLAGVVKAGVVRYHEIFTPQLILKLAPLASPSSSAESSSTPAELSSSPPEAPPAASSAPSTDSHPHPHTSIASSSPPSSRRSFSPSSSPPPSISSSPKSSRRPSLASLYEEEPTVPSASTSASTEGSEGAGGAGLEPLAEGPAGKERAARGKGRRSSTSSSIASTSSRASTSSLSLLDTSGSGGSTLKANPRGTLRGSKSRATVGKSASMVGSAVGGGREDVRGVFAFASGEREGEGERKE
ncbi:hypothetical protein BCR35DRAFT_15813 [Leucosporidium creatinivorum]|uniref:Rho-GAP domain-containing protein n=1 Tax=Leucosporidium creatinivorum TaxID=106004 RepID=A0A1Y2FYU6_9BASI|nr:hypothetical protein BCR35DRAFT_15813 [Leucosporidium creatinivorum]